MKIIKLILISLIGLLTVSCDDDETGVNIDSYCETSYQLDNRTDKIIYVKYIYGYTEKDSKKEEIYDDVTISPKTKEEIYAFSKSFGDNIIIGEMEDYLLPTIVFGQIEVYADNRLLNESLLYKVNWNFSATACNKATYLLVVTDELINSVGYATE